MVAKFGDHLPVFRLAEIYSRQGITLDRATLGNWVGRACFHLRPIVDHIRERLKSADRIFMDETRAPVLDPGRRKTKTGYFWSIVSDDRGHGGAENWPMLDSLIANCKMNDINPVSYLTNTLRALLDGHPKSRIDDLMPWTFATASSLAA